VAGLGETVKHSWHPDFEQELTDDKIFCEGEISYEDKRCSDDEKFPVNFPRSAPLQPMHDLL
jgi:hypothetical protein